MVENDESRCHSPSSHLTVCLVQFTQPHSSNYPERAIGQVEAPDNFARRC